MGNKLLIAMVAAALNFSAQAVEKKDYLLATASTGGTFYPVGVAISTLVKVKLQPTHKISLSAINSAGSGENVRLMRENEVQFAILQGLYGHYAKTGTGPLKESGEQKNLRSVTMLWQNVEHFIVKKDAAKTGTVKDIVAMKGQKAALGKKNSGTIGSNTTLLAGLGIHASEDFELVHGGYGPSADALQNGQVSLASIPAGIPAGAVTKLFAAAGEELVILDVTDEQIKQMNGDKSLWTRKVIPAGTYPNQKKEINTIAQPNILVANSDLPEEDVYLITKAIYENLPFLNGIHKATKAMVIEKAIEGLPIPLHAGALKYYQEVGISVPKHLRGE